MAGLARFSEGISSSVRPWRRYSCRMSSATSGSSLSRALNVSVSPPREAGFTGTPDGWVVAMASGYRGSTGPGRIVRTRSPSTATTVEGTPPGARPPARTPCQWERPPPRRHESAEWPGGRLRLPRFEQTHLAAQVAVEPVAGVQALRHWHDVLHQHRIDLRQDGARRRQPRRGLLQQLHDQLGAAWPGEQGLTRLRQHLGG